MQTLTCLHCGYIETSLDLLNEKSLAECSMNFAKHLSEKHPDKHKSILQDLALVHAMVPGLVLLTKHTTLLDDANLDKPEYRFVHEKIGEVVDSIGTAIGIDISVEFKGIEEGEIEDNESKDKYKTLPRIALH